MFSLHPHSTPDLHLGQVVSSWPSRSNVPLTPAGGRQPAAAVDAGLSIAHIEPREPGEYSLVVYQGANLVSVVAPGGLFAGGGRRGKVSTFSAASRRYLLQFLAKVPGDVPLPYFLTLTYPDEVSWSGARCKRDINVFCKRIRRAFSGSSGIWRIEIKARKTGCRVGQNMPHFHLLVWGLPRKVKEVIEFVSTAWYEVVGAGNPKHLQAGTRVERVRSARGAWFYCSKYIGKVDQVINQEIGRWWGHFGDVPQAPGVEVSIERQEYYKFLRIGRRQVHNGRVRSFFTKADTWLFRVLPFVVAGQEGTGSLAEIDEAARMVRSGYTQLPGGQWGQWVFVPATKGGDTDVGSSPGVQGVRFEGGSVVR